MKEELVQVYADLPAVSFKSSTSNIEYEIFLDYTLFEEKIKYPKIFSDFGHFVRI